MKKWAQGWTVLVLTAAVVIPGGARAAGASGRRAKRLLVTFAEDSDRAGRETAAREMGLALAEDLAALQVAVLEAEEDAAPQAAALARRHPAVAAVEEDVYQNWLLDEPAAFEARADAAIRLLGKAPAPPSRPSVLAAAEIPWGVARVDAPAAWPAGQGEGVRVAVIDTGIDCRHPDLRCSFADGANLTAPGEPPMDDNEHGTHVAGTIAGRGGSAGLLPGVAPRATLVPVKVLNADGAGRLSDIVKGIEWAADPRHGIKVINMSLGGADASPAMARAVKKALAAGVTVVCAAGNSGPGPDTVGYPAGYPGVIAVAASDRRDRVAVFSSRGRVAFIAPGVEILSTVPGVGYKKLSGTSMASPHVAGLAALAVERGAKGPAAVRAALSAAAARLPGLDAAEEGLGLVDAARLR